MLRGLVDDGLIVSKGDRFELTLEGELAPHVFAHRPGRGVGGTAEPVEPSQDLVLELTATGALRGRVYDRETGTGIEGIAIELHRRPGRRESLGEFDPLAVARTLFPLGELSKSQVRARARALGLATADKAESQEICFVPDGDYARVVEALRPEGLPGEGEIVDESGQVLGRHAGDGHHRAGGEEGE